MFQASLDQITSLCIDTSNLLITRMNHVLTLLILIVPDNR
jgi:hypothetical protein